MVPPVRSAVSPVTLARRRWPKLPVAARTLSKHARRRAGYRFEGSALLSCRRTISSIQIGANGDVHPGGVG